MNFTIKDYLYANIASYLQIKLYNCELYYLVVVQRIQYMVKDSRRTQLLARIY